MPLLCCLLLYRDSTRGRAGILKFTRDFLLLIRSLSKIDKFLLVWNPKIFQGSTTSHIDALLHSRIPRWNTVYEKVSVIWKERWARGNADSGGLKT